MTMPEVSLEQQQQEHIVDSRQTETLLLSSSQ
jgi:hypothetical protein